MEDPKLIEGVGTYINNLLQQQAALTREETIKECIQVIDWEVVPLRKGEIRLKHRNEAFQYIQARLNQLLTNQNNEISNRTRKTP